MSDSKEMKLFANMLQTIAVLAVASVLLGALGRFHHLLDLAAHFRIQATIALVVCGLALRICRQNRQSWITLGVAAVCMVLLLPYVPFGPRSRDAQYRLLVMNVLTKNEEKPSVIAMIKSHDPDFVALMETDDRWISTLESELAKRWPHRKSVARSDNFGIAFYSKLPLETCRVREYVIDLTTPSIKAEVATERGRLTIFATHPLPPMNASTFAARNESLAAMADEVSKSPTRTIVAGDLNCTPWSPWFKKTCRDGKLRNSMIGQGLGISWTPFGLSILGLPIDHVLVGSDIEVVNREVGGQLGSDHRPVVLDFSIRSATD